MTCESNPRSQKYLDTVLNWRKRGFGPNLLAIKLFVKTCGDHGDHMKMMMVLVDGGGNHNYGDDNDDDDGYDDDYACLLSSAWQTGRQ